MREWLVFLKSSPEALQDFKEHLAELIQTTLEEEHREKDWEGIREKRGRSSAFKFLERFITQDEREAASEEAYHRALKGK